MNSKGESNAGGPLLGGIEAGGTKFVCAVGRGPGAILEEARFPTTTPEEALGAVVAFFAEAQRTHGKIDALGIGSFGPVDVSDPASAGFGSITTTPKEGWRHFPLLQRVVEGLGGGIPAGFDTDVNAAALAEWRWGAGQGLDSLIYLTVGTGIGGGALVNGALVHGLLHPEMGHLRLPRDHERDPFAGCCPYHGDCLEGLASGPAIEKRWGRPARELPADHAAWVLEGEYLAAALMNMTLILSPQRILLGGGVMEQGQLFPLIRARFDQLRGGYLEHDAFAAAGLEAFIAPPGLGVEAGILGAFALAESALR